MKRKYAAFLLLAGMIMTMGFSIAVTKGKCVLAESSVQKGNQVTVEGSVYDKSGQCIVNPFAAVIASTTVGEDGGPGGYTYFSNIDENGKYHLEMPAGSYYLYFHYHNRSEGKQYYITRSSVIDLRLPSSFYQMSGKMYLNGKLYCNGTVYLQRVQDDPSTTWDDYYIEVETDKKGCYFLSFVKGIDGEFSVKYMVKGAMYHAKEHVTIPGDNRSGYDIIMTGNVDQPASQQSESKKDKVTKKPYAFKKGSTFQKGDLVFKVLSVSKKQGKLAVVKGKRKKASKIVIPATIKRSNISFRVTEVGKRAFYQQKRLKSVYIGANVERIGKQAFYQDNQLKKIVFRTKKLKRVGAKAFIGINDNARLVVPKSCKKQYVRLLNGTY